MKSAVERDVPLRELDSSEVAAIRNGIRVWYDPNPFDRFLWDRFHTSVGVHDADGWRYIEEYVGDRASIIFFDPHDETAMFEIPHGPAITEILANCFGFEFYVTDHDLTFILCHSHDDMLIAAGDAEDWLHQRLG